jgi:elongator complex protein 3
MLHDFVKELVKKKIKTYSEFLIEKQKLIKKFNIKLPSNVEILKTYKELIKKKEIKPNIFFEKKLKKRPVRSLSGVVVISVLTKPWPCPGKCLYCPLEPGIPKSYLSGEPAVERAKLFKYDPFLQVKKRIEALKKTGHPTDKIELIVIGGTWSFLPKNYQTWFIKRCFEAANYPTKTKKRTLEKIQKINEKAKNRIIGLTLETRPDFITLSEIKRMRKLGCTRVELGVQAIDDRILEINKRGHDVKTIIEATKILKIAGFKICYHLMPGLPSSTVEKDFEMFKKIFSDQNFQPDMIKIYPCVVTKGSELYKLWQRGEYKPYTDEQLIDLLIKIKSIVPPYVRIIRIVRDIPSSKIEGGSKISNLREVVQKEMKKRNLKCSCIRCREIKSFDFEIKKLSLVKRTYEASNGKEIFLSFEDIENDKLVAFLRLRLNLNSVSEIKNFYKYFPELKEAAIIREVHTYGELVPIGEKRKAAQHLGLGKKLIFEAEKIAKEFGYKKIAVIAGIGVRDYYRKLGYRLENTYLTKKL